MKNTDYEALSVAYAREDAALVSLSRESSALDALRLLRPAKPLLGRPIPADYAEWARSLTEIQARVDAAHCEINAAREEALRADPCGEANYREIAASGEGQ